MTGKCPRSVATSDSVPLREKPPATRVVRGFALCAVLQSRSGSGSAAVCVQHSPASLSASPNVTDSPRANQHASTSARCAASVWFRVLRFRSICRRTDDGVMASPIWAMGGQGFASDACWIAPPIALARKPSTAFCVFVLVGSGMLHLLWLIGRIGWFRRFRWRSCEYTPCGGAKRQGTPKNCSSDPQSVAPHNHRIWHN